MVMPLSVVMLLLEHNFALWARLRFHMLCLYRLPNPIRKWQTCSGFLLPRANIWFSHQQQEIRYCGFPSHSNRSCDLLTFPPFGVPFALCLGFHPLHVNKSPFSGCLLCNLLFCFVKCKAILLIWQPARYTSCFIGHHAHACCSVFYYSLQNGNICRFDSGLMVGDACVLWGTERH